VSQFGNEYHFGKQPSTWSEANKFCRKLWKGKGTLARINNAQEDNWIFNQAHKKEVWIGGNDLKTEGKFIWSDGCKMSYSKWNAKQPDNKKNEDCVHYASNGKWNDLNCGKKMRFVCKLQKKC